MASIFSFLSSSIGRKKLTALSALAISGFIIVHMAGNLLLLVGAEPYNRYSHALISNPFLPIAQIGLLLMFLTHVAITIKLTLQNRAARGQGYLVQATKQKRTTITSKTTILSGLLILTFLVLHLMTFKYGEIYRIAYAGTEMRDLYRLVVEVFQDPTYIVWYLVCLVVLGFHLSHGIAALFQSFGIGFVSDDRIRKFSALFAMIITIGFCVQPLYIFFNGV